MTEIIKQTLPVFEANPALQQVHVTSDGQSFHNYHSACEHEKTVKGRRVLQDEDLPKTVTREQAYAKELPPGDGSLKTAEGTGEKNKKVGELTITGVSKAAAEMLAEAGIDPATVTGTGTNGQVTKTDAEKAVKAKEAAAQSNLTPGTETGGALTKTEE